MDELIKLLREVSAGVVTQAQLNRGSKWLEAMEQEFPMGYRMLMGLLHDTPERVLDTLASFNSGFRVYRRNPQALAYVRQLQARMRGEKK